MEPTRHEHTKLKLCVSGAAETSHCGFEAHEKARTLGREIVEQGGILTTGATTGFPLWAALGAKEAGGLSIGFSPASSEREHVEHYNLPVDYLDVIVYTSFGFSGRNLLLTRSSDAVFIGCGRIGTINEFTIAFEDKKPIGILEGPWETDEVIKTIIAKGHREHHDILYDDNPRALVGRMIEVVNKRKIAHPHLYANPGRTVPPGGDIIL